MNYSPMAIHCTSLCLDIIQNQKFTALKPSDIEDFRPELYSMINERAQTWSSQFIYQEQFVNDVTNSVLRILQINLQRNCNWDSKVILDSLETSIANSVKNYF